MFISSILLEVLQSTTYFSKLQQLNFLISFSQCHFSVTWGNFKELLLLPDINPHITLKYTNPPIQRVIFREQLISYQMTDNAKDLFLKTKLISLVFTQQSIFIQSFLFKGYRILHHTKRNFLFLSYFFLLLFPFFQYEHDQNNCWYLNAIKGVPNSFLWPLTYYINKPYDGNCFLGIKTFTF